MPVKKVSGLFLGLVVRQTAMGLQVTKYDRYAH